MSSKFLLSQGGDLLGRIKENISSSDEIFFSVAFASFAGLKKFFPEYKDLMKRGGAAKFSFDVTQGLTDPEIIEELATFPGESSVRMQLKNQGGGFSHSKIYHFEVSQDVGNKKSRSIIGSANLSIGGLLKNTEASIEQSGEQVTGLVRDFLNDQWYQPTSIDLLANPKVFESYKKIFDKKKAANASAKKIAKALEELANDAMGDIGPQKLKPEDWVYLVGAIVANAKYQSASSVEARTIRFKFNHRKLNRNEPANAGYIASFVNGELLGGIRLEQNETHSMHAIRIRKRILGMICAVVPSVDFVENATGVKIKNYEFSIKFPEPSEFSDRLFSYISDHLEHSGTRMTQFVPEFDGATQKPIILNFVKGYGDFRSRLSKHDQVPGGSKMRIALQINTASTEFLTQFHDLLSSRLGYNVNVSSGGARGKDNMLRILASKDPQTVELFSSGWRRAMANEYALFNAAN